MGPEKFDSLRPSVKRFMYAEADSFDGLSTGRGLISSWIEADLGEKQG